MATVGLVVLFALGSALVGAVIVVRGRLLDAGTYTAALVRTDAYERTYTEVLADPELAALKEQLLGDLGLGGATAVQARALGTNVLRWTIPPATLRAGTETVIDGVLAYIRGDTARLDADVAIDGVLDRIDTTAVTEARTLLAAAADRSVSTIEAYRDAVADVAAQLAAGRIPDDIPKLGGTTFDPDDVIDAIMDALGPRADDELRRQVTAAVLADDERDALITAAATVVADHAAAVAERLRAGAEDGRELDIVAAIADHARQPAASVVASLDGVRDAARWLRPLTAIVGAVVMAAAAAALVWRERRDPRRAGTVVAIALVVAGVANLALWWLVAGVVAPPLEQASGTGPGTWNLPAGLRTVLADVQHAVADDLAGTVRRFAGVLLVTGVALGAGVSIGRRVGVLRPSVAVAVAAGVAGAIVVVGTLVATNVGTTPPRACNGHVELCDRAYDEIAYAATHNSMSSPDIVPVWPEHDGDIEAQLDAGVRALLIDSKYWPPVSAAGNLTELFDETEMPVPPALTEAWYRTLGPVRDGRDGTFLCHIHCAFGAIEFVDAMVTVREFLERNPDDVVTLIIQDAISTEDTVAVFEAAGLDDIVVTHDLDEPWPTLGNLIDRGERLVVFAEEERPPPDWYANAFEAMQETPFLFLSPDDLSCEPNRGGTEAPLFQMNHWIQRIAPDRVDSVNINRLDVLVDRARQCERERGRMPNYLAVNFYNIGDVVEAADVLNGVD